MHSVKSVRYERTVSYSELQKITFVFSHVEYCDMHFVYGFCNGNALAAGFLPLDKSSSRTVKRHFIQ